MEYIKLADLSGYRFKVLEMQGYLWKRFNEETKKYETSDKAEPGYQKKYTVLIKSDFKGTPEDYKVEMSASQVGTMLEQCLVGENASIKDTYWNLKTNGKTGIEVRYWFNRISV